VVTLRLGLLPLKKDCRLQSCRFGGLEAWMPGCLDARRLGGCRLGSWNLGSWLACLLAGWQTGIGLDWSGCYIGGIGGVGRGSHA